MCGVLELAYYGAAGDEQASPQEESLLGPNTIHKIRFLSHGKPTLTQFLHISHSLLNRLLIKSHLSFHRLYFPLPNQR